MVTHQLQVERRTGKVHESETDVLPLCYATNFSDCLNADVPLKCVSSVKGCIEQRGEHMSHDVTAR